MFSFVCYGVYMYKAAPSHGVFLATNSVRLLRRSEVEACGWWVGEAGQRLRDGHLDSRGRCSVPIGQSTASWVRAVEDAAVLHLHREEDAVSSESWK